MRQRVINRSITILQAPVILPSHKSYSCHPGPKPIRFVSQLEEQPDWIDSFILRMTTRLNPLTADANLTMVPSSSCGMSMSYVISNITGRCEQQPSKKYWEIAPTLIEIPRPLLLEVKNPGKCFYVSKGIHAEFFSHCHMVASIYKTADLL